jgi:hypothetical protein
MDGVYAENRWERFQRTINYSLIYSIHTIFFST